VKGLGKKFGSNNKEGLKNLERKFQSLENMAYDAPKEIESMERGL
jgi:hypothetical protein